MESQNNPVHKVVMALALLAAGWTLTGCSQDEENLGAPNPYLPDPKDLTRIGRVVVMELSYDGTYPNLQQDMTHALTKAIRDRGLFHLETVKRDDPRVRAAAKLQGTKDFKDLAILRKQFGCDALLVGAIHRFEPHPHMQVALYLQLLDLKNGRLIWGLEHTWDVADRTTEKRMRRFFDEKMREGHGGPVDWRLALLSPKAFEKYVACEVAGTLKVPPDPPRKPS